MINRIRQIMEQAEMSQQDFSTTLGISAASLSSIFNGRTNPTNNHVMAIHRAFPQINVNWLLFGEGPMYSDENEPDSEGTTVTNEEGATSADGHVVSTPEPLKPLRSAETRSATENKKASAGDTLPTWNPGSIRPRKIKEIRVFYDDGTYEAFSPSFR